MQSSIEHFFASSYFKFQVYLKLRCFFCFKHHLEFKVFLLNQQPIYQNTAYLFEPNMLLGDHQVVHDDILAAWISGHHNLVKRSVVFDKKRMAISMINSFKYI